MLNSVNLPKDAGSGALTIGFNLLLFACNSFENNALSGLFSKAGKSYSLTIYL
jgi:hypothetical protein